MTSEQEFQPSQITVRAGEAVRWVNKPSTVVHTVTCDSAKAKQPEDVRLPNGAEAFDSGGMQPGATFEHVFSVPGTYKYFCIPHELLGMVGEVVVKPKEETKHGEQAKTESTDQTSTRRQGRTHVPGLLKFLGNFHPPAVQFPIALMVAAAVAELLFIGSGRPFFDIASRYCVWGSALGALVAGPLGWCAGGLRLTDQDWLTMIHRWLGTGTDLLAAGTLVLSELSRRRQSRILRVWFRVLLSVVTMLFLVTGFFGGAIVYGLGHYQWSGE